MNSLQGLPSILISLGLLILAFWAVRFCKKRAKETKGRLDDDLLPRFSKTIWGCWFLFSTATIAWSVGISLPGLNAVLGMAGAALAIAVSKDISGFIAVAMLFFQRPFDIGQDVYYDGEEWTIVDTQGTKIVLELKVDDDYWTVLLPLAAYPSLPRGVVRLRGRWNPDTQRVEKCS